MAFQPGGAPRGRGSGRARGSGRGGTQRSAGGGGAPPLAAQMRQLNRLGEPDEMALFRRYRDLDIIQVRSVYGPTGLLEREMLVPPSALLRAGQQVDGPSWMSVLSVDTLKSQIEMGRERERALARRAARLPKERHAASWDQLTPEERRVLLLSQKEFNSFRAQSAAQSTPKTGAEGRVRPGPAASTNYGAGQNAGDDADEETENESPSRPLASQGGGAPQGAPLQKRSSPRK